MPTEQRKRLAPLTAVRADRLGAGLSLFEVAHQSGLTTYRVSIIERYPSQAEPGELEAHRRAIETLSALRGAA